VFIVKAEQYFEFDSFISLLKTCLAAIVEHVAESNSDSFVIRFRFIQAVERFAGTIIVKFLNVLCFDLIDLTSCLKMPKHSTTFMSTKGPLRSPCLASWFSSWFLLAC
jgi:hypothetical protein